MEFGCKILLNGEKFSPVKFANFVYFCIMRGKVQSEFEMSLHFSAHNTKVYKIRKLFTATFFTFYNIFHQLHHLTEFGVLFPAVLMNISNSKVCQKGEWSIGQ